LRDRAGPAARDAPAAEEVGAEEPHQIHQAVPAYGKRADAEGDGVELWMHQHRKRSSTDALRGRLPRPGRVYHTASVPGKTPARRRWRATPGRFPSADCAPATGDRLLPCA